ncbi:MAG: hypothetical protein M1812_001722 [Candelaria pacifica]|nr:MAG: hypothetical protein M1812_001722 [Candelaria pacifica]
MNKNRNITRRFMEFLQLWKEKCNRLLKGDYKGKDEEKDLRRTVEVEEGMINSRYDEVHGINGLCDILMESAAAMMEPQLLTDYGDYFALNLKRLRKGDMKDMSWRKPGKGFIQWQQVSAMLQDEESKTDVFHDWMSSPVKRRIPDTPIIDDLKKAAKIINKARDDTTSMWVIKEDLSFEIHTYAKRCNLCHSGLEDLIKGMQWQCLAERICQDLASLGLVYRDRPHEQIEMRNKIKKLEHEWFRKCYVVRRNVIWLPSQKACDKIEEHSRSMQEGRFFGW